MITIMIVSLLVVITVEFGKNMRREIVESTNLKDTKLLDTIARSGINMAVVLLAQDSKDNSYDSYHDIWAQATLQDFSSMFEEGHLKLAVSDLSGRLQVNSLVSSQGAGQGVNAATAEMTREILKRLLLSGNFGNMDETQAMGIIDSLVDWIDRDDRESPFGAEDSYYRSLKQPYDCKNGPVSFIEELLLIKGITRDIFYGTKDHIGLVQFLTVYGNDGKININTADPLLLAVLDKQMTPELADAMVDFRKQQENQDKLSNYTWYKQIYNWPGDVSLNQSIVTTKSQYFKVIAIGERGSFKERKVANVHREQNGKVMIIDEKVD